MAIGAIAVGPIQVIAYKSVSLQEKVFSELSPLVSPSEMVV